MYSRAEGGGVVIVVRRIRVSLEVTGLLRFFEPRPFSASAVRNGKPAPDLFLLAAARSQVDPAECIIVEDSAPGIAVAAAAGMTLIGFVGGSPTPGKLASELLATGARTAVVDLLALKGTIAEIRGWCSDRYPVGAFGLAFAFGLTRGAGLTLAFSSCSAPSGSKPI